MNPTVSVIESTGVSENAAKVYTALLRLGKGNYSSLAAAAGLHPQSVKNALRELAAQKFVIRLDRKIAQAVWRPVPPHEISKHLRYKYEEFVQALPALQGLYREHPTTFVRVSAGNDEAITHIRDHLSQLSRGMGVHLIGTSWEHVQRDHQDDWTMLQAEATRRGLGWTQHAPRRGGRGSVAFLISPRRITIYVYDPTESIVVTIDQPRAAKQLAGLLI